MNRKIKIVILGLLLCSSTSTNGQPIKKIIRSACVYIGTWDACRSAENIELVKTWNNTPICIVSFENGLFSASDETGKVTDEGKWKLETKDNNSFVIITRKNNEVDRFEVVSAIPTTLKLKRVMTTGHNTGI